MTTRDQLNAYLGDIERRLRLGALLRGGAILTSVALSVTVALVLIANALAFSSWSLTTARVALILALAFAAGFGLAVPLYGLDRRRASSKAEQVFPKFQQRLITFTERDSGARDPFLELLADDTLKVARDAEPKQLITDRALFASLCAGVASLAVLIWLIVAGPGFLGHGAALLWVGAPKDAAPMYDIRITPGDAAVRRNTDQLVTADLVGLQTNNVRLFARYQSASKWEEVNMQPQQGGSGFQFLFAGLPEGVEYYVEAGPLATKHFNLRVLDLPSVKQIKVTYRFPSWTGMPAAVEEHGGDLRAVEGTDAELQITTDRPLRDGLLAVDDQQLKLSGGQGNVYTSTVHMEKDGLYHVAQIDQGQSVRLSGDYFIEAQKANPPEVHITRPGRDYRSSPIEEVTLAASASDEFGLGDVALHYSVNGGPEKVVSLLKQKGSKQADGSSLLALEDYKLVPGDLVSFYATAKDAHAESHTDMFFIQADPFEREFSQSQAAGGGGGGGGGGQGDQTEISEREKQIIAATWNQQTNMKATKQEASETAKFLSGTQSKLRDQALSLAGRLERRELTEQNQEFSDFQKDMNAAAGEMGPAADKLQSLKWSDAIPAEQRALQHLLRAEATFRQIEVAFGARGGGGGGAGGGAGRDLSSLFDLELDTEKNQYETGQTASSDSQRAQEIDAALQKLEELARRQQELADQQNTSKQSLEQQRWEQEMLRRDAEELQRQMEQMARNQQQGQSGQSGQSGSPSNSASGNSSGSSSSQASAAQRAQQALDRLREANDDMRRAASQGQQGQNDADARRAADRLREATDLLGGTKQQQASGQVDELSREAQRLSEEQRAQAERMRGAFGQNGQSAQNGQSTQNGQSAQNGAGRQGQGGQAPTAAQRQEQGKLADDRQRMAGDLAQLEKRMQDAERALGSTQRDAASKLRDALGGLDEADLKGRLQRSSDELRRGIDPNSSERQIGAGLQALNDQLRQAQQAAGGQQQGKGNDSQQALDRVERLRNQMEALSRTGGNGNGNNGGQPGQGQAGGQRGGQGGQNGNGGRGQAGPGGNGFINGYNGEGYAGGRYGYGDIGSLTPLTGTERQPTPVTQADIQRAYQNAIQELNDLQREVQGQPEPLADISELLKEMQQLDPRRFPGNPAMLEELHGRVLATVDQLELKLRQEVDDKAAGQVRAGDSLPVPAGYQDAVAEYFRRLSKTQ